MTALLTALKKLWEGWKALGRFMGNMVARVLLSVFYVTIFLPFGLGVRLFTDPLQIKSRPSSLWQARSTPDQSLADSRRQF